MTFEITEYIAVPPDPLAGETVVRLKTMKDEKEVGIEMACGKSPSRDRKILEASFGLRALLKDVYP